MSAKELSAVAPFHMQAEVVGGYLQSARARECAQEAKCVSGRPGCPSCNAD